jgi:hypothetical protein
VLENSLDELESIQKEEEVKNVLVTIIDLMITSTDAKTSVESRRASGKILQQNSAETNQLRLFNGTVEAVIE